MEASSVAVEGGVALLSGAEPTLRRQEDGRRAVSLPPEAG